jgi:DNA-binding MarR family transcriptional regulator
MPKWKGGSIFGTGPRVPLDREQRAQFRAKLKLQRQPGRLTIAAAEIGRILVDMLGAGGQLDPSVATIAARAAVDPSTVTRAMVRLRDCGFLTWTRRLVRDVGTGWRVEQTSNAYVLTVPATDMHFALQVSFTHLRKPAVQEKRGGETIFQSAARQLRALGMPVPVSWGDV